jgi:hypothetical protein
VKAYFIYDHREEHVYQQYANELEAMEAEARLPQEIAHVDGNSQHASSVQGNITLPNHNVEPSSIREWDVWSRAPQIMINPLPEQAFSSQMLPNSKNNSEENNIEQGHKSVESFEVGLDGISRSNSSGSIKRERYRNRVIDPKCFLRSFDSLNIIEDDSSVSYKDESLNAPPMLPLIRARVRSYELSNQSPPGQITLETKIKLIPIDEEEEHHCD